MRSSVFHATIPEIPRQPQEPHLLPPMVFVQPVWEYRTLSRSFPEPGALTEAELNAMGADGWELVGICPEPSGGVCFYFKRLTR